MIHKKIQRCSTSLFLIFVQLQSLAIEIYAQPSRTSATAYITSLVVLQLKSNKILLKIKLNYTKIN